MLNWDKIDRKFDATENAVNSAVTPPGTNNPAKLTHNGLPFDFGTVHHRISDDNKKARLELLDICGDTPPHPPQQNFIYSETGMNTTTIRKEFCWGNVAIKCIYDDV